MDLSIISRTVDRIDGIRLITARNLPSFKVLSSLELISTHD